MKYIHMDVEIDNNGRYVRCYLMAENNGKREIVLSTNDSSIHNYMVSFSKQEGISLRQLMEDRQKVSFRRMGLNVAATKVYDYANDGLNYNYQRHYRSLNHVKYRKEYRRNLAKRILTLTTIGVITISSITASANYLIKRNNAYNNKYITITHHGNQKMDREIFKILGDYDEMDNIIASLANENWSNLKGKNLESFYQKLDVLLMSNIEGIKHYYETGRNGDESFYSMNFKDYFANDPISYAALESFENSLSVLVIASQRESSLRQNKELDYCISKLMKFLVDEDFSTKVDEVGNKVYYNINNIHPLARYIILKNMKPILEMVDFKYDIYDKEYIMKKLDDRINGSVRNINYYIVNSNSNEKTM